MYVHPLQTHPNLYVCGDLLHRERDLSPHLPTIVQ